MATDDEKRPDAGEDQSLDVASDELVEEELDDAELERTAGGLRMDKVGARLGRTSRFVGNTATRPKGATVTIPGLNDEKSLKGR
jgi:hypothetical protein